MKKERIYYIVIAVGVLSLLVTVLRLVGGRHDHQVRVPAVTPDELLQQILGPTSADQKQKAARLLLQHGEAGRRQVREALNRYEGDDAEVLAPLLLAAKELRDWQSMPALLEYAEHENPKIRGRAGMAAQKILTADLGFRAKDPVDKRADLLRQMILRDAEIRENDAYPRLFPEKGSKR